MNIVQLEFFLSRLIYICMYTKAGLLTKDNMHMMVNMKDKIKCCFCCDNISRH